MRAEGGKLQMIDVDMFPLLLYRVWRYSIYTYKIRQQEKHLKKNKKLDSHVKMFLKPVVLAHRNILCHDTFLGLQFKGF